MWTSRLLYSGLSLLLVGIAGSLLLSWELGIAVFAGTAIGVAFLGVVVAIAWDVCRQTTTSSLAARGIYPDDGNLPVLDPGLRRDWGPMVASPARLRKPTAPVRHRAAPPTAARKAARSERTRPHSEPLQPDATITFASERRAAGVDDLYAALDSELIGLAPVKQRVSEIGSLLLVDRARQRFGLSMTRPNLHMCFTGAPGTGKTTVAVMMADLLHRLGYLEQGHLVHAMRDDLVGEYIGQTAPKTKYVLSRAMGGVLFIDEAYSLYRAGDSKDYGQECVDILMQVMENERHGLVVILAGYKDRMDRFFESNPGMRSRVAHHLDFAAYQTDELLAIGGLMLDQSSYYLSDEATTAFRHYLSLEIAQPEFANARSVRNALESARLRHAHRLAAEPERRWSKDDLMRLEPPDVLFQGGETG